MINETELTTAVEIITEKILTPVLYMYEEEVTEFICFSDSNTSQEDFDDAERAVFDVLGLQCEIVDIREFPETDRLEISNTARAVYTADPLVQMLFESAMYADVQRIIDENHSMIQRKADTQSYYLN
ncbi:MAG: hypothetical protein PUD92_04745 [Clostridiales bacterium]|nr:hypothetical protein [Clostridiales bacterium]